MCVHVRSATESRWDHYFVIIQYENLKPRLKRDVAIYIYIYIYIYMCVYTTCIYIIYNVLVSIRYSYKSKHQFTVHCINELIDSVNYGVVGVEEQTTPTVENLLPRSKLGR